MHNAPVLPVGMGYMLIVSAIYMQCSSCRQSLAVQTGSPPGNRPYAEVHVLVVCQGPFYL